MTRDEAEKKIIVPFGSQWLVDALAELGVLKLEKPSGKKPDRKAKGKDAA